MTRSYQHWVPQDMPEAAPTLVQVAPPSSDLKRPSRPPSFPPAPNASCTAAYSVEGEDTEIASWIRPTLVVGNPPARRVQVAPPFIDLYTPLGTAPGLHDVVGHPMAANRTARSDGCCTRSVVYAASTWLHAAPLFVDLYSPKLVAAKTVELVAEPAVPGSRTSFAMRAPPFGVSKIEPASWIQVTPPSVDRSTPQP